MPISCQSGLTQCPLPISHGLLALSKVFIRSSSVRRYTKTRISYGTMCVHSISFFRIGSKVCSYFVFFCFVFDLRDRSRVEEFTMHENSLFRSHRAFVVSHQYVTMQILRAETGENFKAGIQKEGRKSRKNSISRTRVTHSVCSGFYCRRAYSTKT